jgi:4-amino-4-deoxy-L-arabinose transferase-like glycosyltransferase
VDAPGDLSQRGFRLGVLCTTAAVAAFLLARLHAWPPHEDETLALFIGSKPLGQMLRTVLDLRGGAPLHFLIVNLVAHISPSLTALRLISATFAVASVPAVAMLVARLTNRTTALTATVLLAASWVTLFHGIYGRMYSLFLFLSALSFIALLRAIEKRRPIDWGLWGLAILATMAAHQYGTFVLGSQVIFTVIMARRRRFSVRPLLLVTAVVALCAIPLWRSSLVLADRVDVGIGGSGTWLGGPVPFLEYLRRALGDFVASWTFLFAITVAVAGLGLVLLVLKRRASALLLGLAFAVPAAGLALTRIGSSASAPETRHLIFLLPFFMMLVAVGLVYVARLARGRWPAVLAISVSMLVAAEVAWGWHETPALYAGEPAKRKSAREAAQQWLASTSRPSDVLFGYDPLYLGALGGHVSNVVVPRADPELALKTLLRAPEPLGRGVWVLDATEGARIVNNWSARLQIEDRSPGPGFVTRTFGPFLVIRTLGPTVTPEAFLNDTLEVQSTGESLFVDSSGLNYQTARLALERLEARGSGTPSTAPALPLTVEP